MWERQRRHLQGEKLRDIAITVYRLIYVLIWAAQLVKYWPAMLDTQVPSPDQEDPLEKEMVSHSSILAWKNPMVRGIWQAVIPGITESRT